MTKLGVNIDHVATIRQARKAPEPDPVSAAVLAELAGADGITVHLRGDRRHISERDVRLLREVVTTRLNIEMAVTRPMLELALEIHPDTVTLVPESPDEITTQGGLALDGSIEPIRDAVRKFLDNAINVSLFIDPEPSTIERARRSGAPLVEFNTAAYAEAVPKGLDEAGPAFARELDRLRRASEQAASLGFRVLAGHGLTYRNVRPVSNIEQIFELNIGHNIISRAVLVGMERAVREMLEAMNG